MKLFLGNSITSPRSGATSRTAPAKTGPRRSEQLPLTLRSANHPGNGSDVATIRCHSCGFSSDDVLTPSCLVTQGDLVDQWAAGDVRSAVPGGRLAVALANAGSAD